MNKIINKIADVLKSSPFGSGELAADFLPWLTEEELKSAKEGLYNVEAGDDGVEVGFVSPQNKDYPCLDRGISWLEIVRVPFEISNGTLRVILGCGFHCAEYVFYFTGELIDVSPDELPSSRFYRDGDNVDLDKRKAYLMKFK